MRAAHLRSHMSATSGLSLSLAALLTAAIGMIWLATIWLCAGHFVYALDDPYISLEFAEHIAHGHYGLNASELSSPASSVLYPLLLVVFYPFQLGIYAPLFVNFITSILLCLFLVRVASDQKIVEASSDLRPLLLMLLFVCFAIDAPGLVFIGLEHLIHMLVSMLIIFGLAATIDRRVMPLWLPVLVATAPFWRFEATALSLLACLGLYMAGEKKAAVWTTAATSALLAGYGILMRQAGLPVLPSSVLAKSTLSITANQSPFLTAIQGVADGATEPEAWPLIVVAATLVVRVTMITACRSARRDKILVMVYCGMLVAHVCFGGWRWGERYTAYLAGTAVAVMIFVFGGQIRSALSSDPPWKFGLVCLMITLFGGNYILYTAYSPIESRTVYRQQYQLRRFVLDYYKGPVAVNDVGNVSFRNSSYVLDLWGVSNEEARIARLRAEPGWMQRLVTEHDVKLAVVYDSWFAGMIPPTWRRIATLTDPDPLSAGGKIVSFYATSPAGEPAIIKAFEAFRPTLPRDVAVWFPAGDRQST